MWPHAFLSTVGWRGTCTVVGGGKIENFRKVAMACSSLQVCGDGPGPPPGRPFGPFRPENLRPFFGFFGTVEIRRPEARRWPGEGARRRGGPYFRRSEPRRGRDRATAPTRDPVNH